MSLSLSTSLSYKIQQKARHSVIRAQLFEFPLTRMLQMSADNSPLVLLIVTVVPSVSIVLIFLLGHPMGQKYESQKKKTCQTGKKKKKNIKGDQTRDASKENSEKKLSETEELQSYRTKELKALEEILCDEIPKMKSGEFKNSSFDAITCYAHTIVKGKL